MIHVIGSDECGLGALCGPITVCAFLAPSDWTHASVKDSKKYSNRSAREVVGKMLRQDKESWYSIVNVEAHDIDRIGYENALDLAHCTAIMNCVEMLLPQDRYEIIIDGNRRFPLKVPYQAVPKADAKYIHVSAASVLAKTRRDFEMRQYAKQWPQYSFEMNAGYGTALHLAALKKHGPCPIHRKSLNMMRDL